MTFKGMRLRTRISYLRYDIHTRTDLFQKASRCKAFLFRAFGNHPEYDLSGERVLQYIEEAEFGEHPWKDFFKVPGRPWAIDWAMLAMDFLLWLNNTKEFEAEQAKEAEQYHALTGESLDGPHQFGRSYDTWDK